MVVASDAPEEEPFDSASSDDLVGVSENDLVDCTAIGDLLVPDAGLPVDQLEEGGVPEQYGQVPLIAGHGEGGDVLAQVEVVQLDQLAVGQLEHLESFGQLDQQLSIGQTLQSLDALLHRLGDQLFVLSAL